MRIDEHKQVAANIKAIRELEHKIFEMINGRVSKKIVIQLCTFRGVDKALMKFDSDMENEFCARYPKEQNPYD